MNQSEFMDLLRYYFRKADPADVADILSDYEAHFAEGKKAGLTEEAIAKELGSPKAIYEMYLHEGMIREAAPAGGSSGEALSEAAGKMARGAADLARQAKVTYDAKVRPQVPEALSGASALFLQTVYMVCYGMSGLVFLFTFVLVYILSGTLPSFDGLSPLPGLSFLTVFGFGGSGFFAGLSLFLIARKVQAYCREREEARHDGAASDEEGDQGKEEP